MNKINMYLLAGKSCGLYGIFSTKEKLNDAVTVVRKFDPYVHLYWQEIKIDDFDSTLAAFFSMHPEKLIEIEREYETT